MKTEDEVVKEHVDEFGINRSKFVVGRGEGSSQFFKLKDGEKAEVTIKKGGVRQVDKEFKKFNNNKPVLDEKGNPVIERVGPALELDIESVNGEEKELIWEVTAKKLSSTIFSFLDKREKDGTPYLFSRVFQVERKGTGTATTYVMFPTEAREPKPAAGKGQQNLNKGG
jgi:hypothetical protein